MGTVLFVHGAGIRFPEDREMFEQIQVALQHHRPDLVVDACSWGGHLGSRLHAGGASLPRYTDMHTTTASLHLPGVTAAFKGNTPSHMQETWIQLQKDPFYELATLVRMSKKQQTQKRFVDARKTVGFSRTRTRLTGEGSEAAWQELDTRLHELHIPLTLQIKLTNAGIAEQFAPACETLFSASLYKNALQNVSSQTDHDAFARLLARALMALIYQQQEQVPTLYQLDEIITLLSVEIARSLRGEAHHTPGQWQQFARSLFTRSQQERQRRVLIDMFMPFIGDIVLYQARGEQLRHLILEHIHHISPPVTLLAHSLGGVACVDILVQQHLPQVHSLITTGSQVPLLYEMDALQSLPFGQALPPHFPAWLNIYDMRDILSYVGEELFPGHVRDVRVNNKHVYPQAHNTYWTNAETWQALLPFLPQAE